MIETSNSIQISRPQAFIKVGLSGDEVVEVSWMDIERVSGKKDKATICSHLEKAAEMLMPPKTLTEKFDDFAAQHTEIPVEAIEMIRKEFTDVVGKVK
jgi:hypothetical protein